MAQVRDRTLLSFAAQDISLYGNSKPINFGWTSGNDWVVDTGKQTFGLVDIDFGPFGAFEADAAISFQFGLRLNAGLGGLGTLDTSYEVAVDVEYDDFVVAGLEGTDVVFDFTNSSIVSAESASQGIGSASVADIDGVDEDDQPDIPVGVSLELVLGASFGIENISYRLPFSSTKKVRDLNILDFENQTITLFEVNAANAQQSFELSDDVDIVLRIPTGADTEGSSNGSTIVSDKGYSDNPFLSIEGDLDALLIRLLKTIPGVNAVAATLEKTVFLNEEIDIHDYVPFLPEEWFTFEVTMVDLSAAAGLHVTEEVSVDIGYKDDENLPDFQVGGGTSIIDQLAGLVGLGGDDPGQTKTPNVGVVLRSDNGTPENRLDDFVTRGSLGDKLELPQPNGTTGTPGLVTVDAWYDVESAKVSHSVGLGGSFKVSLTVLQGAIGGSVGEKLGISFGPLYELDIPSEDGLQVDLFNFFTRRFDAEGGTFSNLPDGRVSASNDEFSEWGYTAGAFGQSETAQYQYYWTNVTAATGLDESDPASRAKTIAFAEANASWLTEVQEIFQPLFDNHRITPESTVILNAANNELIDRRAYQPTDQMTNTAVLWTASGIGESKVELAVGQDNIVIAAPTADPDLDGIGFEYAVTYFTTSSNMGVAASDTLDVGLGNIEMANFFGRTSQTLQTSPSGAKGGYNFTKVQFGEKSLDSNLSPNILGTQKNDLVIFVGEIGYKNNLTPVFNAPEYLDGNGDTGGYNSPDYTPTGAAPFRFTVGDVFVANFHASFTKSATLWDMRGEELRKVESTSGQRSAIYRDELGQSVNVSVADYDGTVLRFVDDRIGTHDTIVRNFETFLINFGDQDDVIRTGISGHETFYFNGGNDTLWISSDTYMDRYFMGAGDDTIILDRVTFRSNAIFDFGSYADYILGGTGHDEVLISSEAPAPNLTDQQLSQGLVWAFNAGEGVSRFYTTEDGAETLLFGLERMIAILGSENEVASDVTSFPSRPIADETYVQVALAGKFSSGARIGSDVEAISVDGFDASADLVFYTGGKAYSGGEGSPGDDPVDVFVADFAAYEEAKTVDGVAPGGVTLNASVDGIAFADSFVGEFERFVVRGSSQADVLVGGKLDDWLDGGLGADVLAGGGNAGAVDVLIGGVGDDLVYFDGLSDIVAHGDAYSGSPATSGRAGYDTMILAAPTDRGGADQGLRLIIDGNLVDHSSSFAEVNVAADQRKDAAAFTASFGDPNRNPVAFGYGFEATNVQGSDAWDDILLYDGGATYIGGERQGDADLFVADFSAQVEGLELLVTDDPSGAGGVLLENGVALAGIDRISVEFGSGMDTIRGGRLDDYIDGGGGNDVLTAEGGSDILRGGAGNDFIYWEGDDGRDQVFGGTGSDRLMISNTLETGSSLGAGGLYYDATRLDENGIEQSFTRGLVTASSDTGTIDDLVRHQDQADFWFVVVQNARSSVQYTGIEAVDVQGSDAFDDFVLYQGGDLYAGGERSGDADLFAANMSDETADLTFSGRNAPVGGSVGDAFYDIGNGTMVGEFERLFVLSGSGNDDLTGGALNDVFESGSGNDTVKGSLGNDLVDAGEGDDQLTYIGGFDTLVGGAGEDRLEIGAQDGGYSLHWLDALGNAFGNYVVAGAIGGAAAYRFSFDQILNSGDLASVVLDHEFGRLTYSDIEYVFASGSGAADVFLSGTSGGVLSTDGGDDILLSNTGDDFLIGGEGRDAYIFGESFGHDIVANEFSGSSEIHFVGLDLADLSFATDSSGTGLVISKDAENSVTITGYFASSANPRNFTFFADDTAAMGQKFDASGLATVQTDAQSIGEQFLGTNADDEFAGGTDRAEFFFGFNGDDVFQGSLGADLFDGSLGNDLVSYETSEEGIRVDLTNGLTATGGQAAGDIFSGIESVFGTGFADELLGTDQANSFFAGEGDDSLAGQTGNDILSGGYGVDLIDGGAGDDMMFGGDGDDVLRADYDSDAGDDYLFGDGGDDVLVDLTGDNRFVGGQGNDFAEAGGGDDVYLFEGEADPDGSNPAGNGGRDTFSGGGGIDLVDFREFGAGIFFYTSQDETYSGVVETSDQDAYDLLGDNRLLLFFDQVENVTGTDFQDILWGSGSNNRIDGRAGDDILVGFGGADTLTGGAGADTVDYRYEAGSGGVSVNLSDGTATDSFGDTDTLAGIEAVTGTDRDDFILGDLNANTFTGHRGADGFNGGAGIDTLDYSKEDGAAGIVANLRFGAIRDTHGDTDVALLIENFILTDQADSVLAGSTSINIDARGGDDTLVGSSVADVLAGGLGANSVDSGAGDDTYLYQNGSDTVDGGDGFDVLNLIASSVPVNVDIPGQLVYRFASPDRMIEFRNFEQIVGSTHDDGLFGYFGDDILIGWSGDDIVEGRDGNDSLFGNSGNDTIIGGGGSDKLYGGSGNDSATGGAGDDLYVYTAGQDEIDGGAGFDTVSFEGIEVGLAVSMIGNLVYGADTVVEHVPPFGPLVVPEPGAEILAGILGVEKLIGTDQADHVENVEGAGAVDELSLLGGDDYVYSFLSGSNYKGGDGFDTVSYALMPLTVGAAGLDIDLLDGRVEGGSAFDLIAGFEGAVGTDGNDSFTGNAVNNSFVGGRGRDNYVGGAGSDTVDFSGEVGPHGIVANLFSSSVHDSYGNFEFVNGVENVIGTRNRDYFFGNAADNLFDGGAGDDEINGGDGNDTLSDGLGRDTVGGGSGDDVLAHLGGFTIFDGGAGFDWIDLSRYAAAVTINLDEAVRTVGSNGEEDWSSAAPFSQSAELRNIENAAGSLFSDLLIGNRGNNALFGDMGDDTFVGNAGADNFTGGDGVDIVNYSLELGSGGVNASLAANSAADTFGEIDTFGGIEGVVGTLRDDFLGGDKNNNILIGMGGSDTIDGGFGIDTIDYSREIGLAGVTVRLDEGFAVDTSGNVDTIYGIEHVIGTRDADRLFGDDSNNILEGNAGADTLFGGQGLDSLSGGADGDTFRILSQGGTTEVTDFELGLDILDLTSFTFAEASAAVAEASGDVDATISFADGSNVVLSGIAAVDLSAANIIFAPNTLQVERAPAGGGSVVGTERAEILQGQDGDDTLRGGSGEDVISGGAGDDYLDGGQGRDTVSYENTSGGGVVVDLGNGTASGAAGNDTLRSFEGVIGSEQSDMLQGSSGPESFFGMAGDDVIEPGTGGDRITTGSGSDEIRAGLADIDGDRILDFGTEDQITLAEMRLTQANLTLSVSTEFTALEIDADQDGIVDARFILEGDYRDETFAITSDGSASSVRLAGVGSLRLGSSDDRFMTDDDGPNRIYGDDGDDVIGAAGGADTLSGGAGADVLKASDGDDVLLGGLGSDTLIGGRGSDVFVFDADDFSPDGTTRDVIADFKIGTDRIELTGFGITGFDSLEFITLGDGDAIDLGGNRYVALSGLTRNDLSEGDFSFGATGRSFGLVSPDVAQDLTDADDLFATSQQDGLVIAGGAGDDTIVGGSGDDTVLGGTGADVVIGGRGEDVLDGGQGSDIYTGRGGADRFVFTANDETGLVIEVITDFQLGIDTFELNGFEGVSPGDLSFSTTDTGDVALRLAEDRIVVFEGIANASELVARGTFDLV